ncbi:MAG TPA: L,D-transpeptidase family protein [Candidatus Limnocylindrales bacterium]|nr:L,D-transpeptidase family protein [Candidatus Limnocylindrales bacterium]
MATPSKRAPETGTPLPATPSLERRSATTAADAYHERTAPRRALPFVLGGAAAGLLARDAAWHVRRDKRYVAALLVAVVAVVALYLILHVTQNRIFPNVWALGVNVGDMTEDEAAAALQQEWDINLRIRMTDEDRAWDMAPADLGMSLDARATATAARDAGLGGIPFSWNVQPVVNLNELVAQTALLNMSEAVKIVPYNAGYTWQNDQLAGVPGTPGRYMDVAGCMLALQAELQQVADRRQFALVMTPAMPDVIDPEPYMAQASALASRPFLIRGYDPFTDEQLVWMADPRTVTDWLEAGPDSLTLREEPFARYLNEQSAQLEVQDSLRFLEPTDAIDKMRSAIGAGQSEVTLRIRYRSSTHEVVRGDSGYSIAREAGVPFYMVQRANPARDWDTPIYAGEIINVPSRDLVLPYDPVPNKRIVIDLETQQLWAFENGQLVFNWLISSGMDRAPTSPGTYQVLSHVDEATGSSVELCGDSSCGTWEMYWFMGIYETVPGLVNGFHGAVLLPGGRYLGGGNVGSPFTYGCIMSQNDQAEQLYRWADQGTAVEIVSREYAPQSQLAISAVRSVNSPTAQIIPNA